MLEVLRDHVKHGVGLLLIAVPESDLDLLEQLRVEGPDRPHQPEDLVPDFDVVLDLHHRRQDLEEVRVGVEGEYNVPRPGDHLGQRAKGL